MTTAPKPMSVQALRRLMAAPAVPDVEDRDWGAYVAMSARVGWLIGMGLIGPGMRLSGRKAAGR